MHRILPFLLLYASLAAQGPVVSPGHFASAEATSQNRFPFGESPAPTFRYLQVHDDVQGQPRVVRGLSFRRVGHTSLLVQFAQPFPAYSVTLDAWCSTATTTAGTLVGTFDANHGTDRAQVVNSRAVNFPAAEAGPIPQPFAYNVPFDAPFIHLGTGPFCWEVQITARTNTLQVYHDAASGASNTNPPLGRAVMGEGCRVTGQGQALAATPSGSMSWPAGTATITTSAANGPPSGVLLFVLGFNLRDWAGLPLPFEIPGSSAAPSGRCTLYHSAALVQAAPTTASGTASVSLPAPATPNLHGLAAYSQFWALDAAANPIGLVTSNAAAHAWTAPWTSMPVGRVFLSGNLGATGSAAPNNGLVTRLDS